MALRDHFPLPASIIRSIRLSQFEKFREHEGGVVDFDRAVADFKKM